MSINEATVGNGIDWTSIIVAGAAALSALFAFLALKQARKIHSEQKRQNRCYLAPHANPGKLIIAHELGEVSHLKIVLVNYGNNPASEIQIKVLTYNQADIEDRNPSVLPVISKHLYINNPVARDIDAKFAITGNGGEFDFGLMASNYVVCRVKYKDIDLGETFKDTFYWIIGRDNELMEVEPPVLAKLKEFLVLDYEFWSKVKVDNTVSEEGKKES